MRGDGRAGSDRVAVKRLGVSASVVRGVLVPGDVEVDGSLVSGVGLSPAASSGLATAGFVDLQVNATLHGDLASGDPDVVRSVASGLVAHGVTSFQPTLHNLTREGYLAALVAIGEAATSQRGARIIGAHLEGPFLSAAWAGSHDVTNFVDPDFALVEELLQAGPVTMVTVAPELEGCLALVEKLADRGVVVSIGHSDASAEVVHDAVDRGARAITHLWNAHRRLTSRDPGPAGVGLTRSELTLCVIADRRHLARETLLLTFGAAGGRVALVSDLTGGDGGGDDAGGEATAAPLAGGVSHMDDAVRCLVEIGVPLNVALGAASLVPGRLVGFPSGMVPGAPADVVVLDDELAVTETLVGGRSAL